MGGHAAALLAIGALYLARGPAAGVSALLTALAVLAFFGVGQLVQIVVADADPQIVLLAALGSYVFRVGLPALALVAIASDPQRLAGIDRVAVAVTAIIVVLGWLGAEIWTFTKLRIPLYDPPQPDPR